MALLQQSRLEASAWQEPACSVTWQLHLLLSTSRTHTLTADVCMMCSPPHLQQEAQTHLCFSCLTLSLHAGHLSVQARRRRLPQELRDKRGQAGRAA